MTTSDRARRIRAQFDALPSQPRRQRAEPKPAPTAAEQIFPSLHIQPAEQERQDRDRGHVSPLGGKANNWEQ
jgi:hypothetical protein